MTSEAGKAKKIWRSMLILLFVVLALTPAQALFAKSHPEKTTVWEYGLTVDLYNRGIKWTDQTSTLKSLNLMLDLKAKNLSNFLDLNLFAGLGNTSLNGLLFEHLPRGLDYQGGQISGLIFGVKAGADLFSASDFIFGATADFATYLSFNKTFPIEDLVVNGQAKAEPSWSQASAGIVITYDGFENIQPFIEANLSFLWGQFKMTEIIEDLEGAQTINIKNSTLMSLTLGWNISLADKISLIPKVRAFPGKKTIIGAGLSFVYGF